MHFEDKILRKFAGEDKPQVVQACCRRGLVLSTTPYKSKNKRKGGEQLTRGRISKGEKESALGRNLGHAEVKVSV